MDNLEPLSTAAIAVLHQLFAKGPTSDGNVVSKTGRGDLIRAGYADRVEGFAFLTKEGVRLAVSVYEREKL